MCRDRKQIQHDTIVEYDTAGRLAGRIAELEGLENGTQAWADRLVEVYEEARAAVAGD